ncbi:MAG: DivIVA domain-containing protein [Propionibacteriaceae bacterium]|jgi:DivIVA domain-containing protein|nr:DivIVA domain-containing protein [Propionibacteriaceae bacterium]
MTLTLEQINKTRFHLARGNGYEPADVDAFVDKVVTTFEALTSEINNLRSRVEELEKAPKPAAPAPEDRRGSWFS